MDLSARMFDSVSAAASAALSAASVQPLQPLQQHPGCSEGVSVLASSSLYLSIIVFKGSFGIAGALVNILHLMFRGTAWSGHTNTSIALHYFYAANVIVGVANGAIHFTEYARLTLLHCDNLDFRIVLALRGLNVSAVIAKALILLLTSLERLYASFRPEQYYDNPAPKRTHALCIILSLFATFSSFFIGSKYGHMLFTKIEVATLDLKTSYNEQEYQILVWSMAGLQCCTIVVCFLAGFVSRIVRRVTRKKGGLVNEKYQLEENIKVLNVLLPVASIDAFVSLSGSILQLAVAPHRASWSVLASQLYLVSYTFAGYNIISLPAGVEILKLCKRLKKACMSAGNKVGSFQHPTVIQDQHFDTLAKAWRAKQYQPSSATVETPQPCTD